MCIPLHLALESAPASAYSLPHPALEYSIPHSTCAERAHPANSPEELQRLPRHPSSQFAPHSRMDHWRNVHTANPRTTAASSSFQPQPRFSPPKGASVRTSLTASVQLRRFGGNFGTCPAESEQYPYKKSGWMKSEFSARRSEPLAQLKTASPAPRSQSQASSDLPQHKCFSGNPS